MSFIPHMPCPTCDAKDARIKELSSRLDSLQKEHDALIHDHERAMAREVNGMQQVAELEDQLAEALERDRKGDQIIHELTLERDRLAGRLDAIREIVEPTGAYLFSGHVNALAEIRAILVERQTPFDRSGELRHEHKYEDDGWCSCGVHALGSGPCVHWVGEVPEVSYSAKCRKCGETVPLVSATRSGEPSE